MLNIIPKEEVFRFIQRTIAYHENALETVQDIIRNVKENKDKAVSYYTSLFDKVNLESVRVTEQEVSEAVSRIDTQLLDDLRLAAQNIRRYHEKQLPTGYQMDVLTKSYVGQLIKPIQSVGIYVPGGTASYPSTVLMDAIPASIAGVSQIVMITPPNKQGCVDDIILAAAQIAGIDEIYKVGGAQGIAALAYGTETIPQVSKIIGPGNLYVALAKKEVFGQVGIDMIAGPSEITILADEYANPSFIAADLISQAEHDEMASAILVTTSRAIAIQVQQELEKQVPVLKRKKIITTSFQNYGGIIIVDDIQEGIAVINQIAPEHLELMIQNPESILNQIDNYQQMGHHDFPHHYR